MTDQAVPKSYGLPRVTEWREVVLKRRVRHPLRTMRDERGLTQQELGDLSGISHVTIGKIENGRYVSVKTLRAVACALNVTVEDIVAANQAAVVDTRDELAELTNGREVSCACEVPGGVRATLARWFGVDPDDARVSTAAGELVAAMMHG